MNSYKSPASRTGDPTTTNKATSPQIKLKPSMVSPEVVKTSPPLKQTMSAVSKHISPPSKLYDKTKVSSMTNLNTGNLQSPRAPVEKVGSLTVIQEVPRKGTMHSPQNAANKFMPPTKTVVSPKGRPHAPRMSEEPVREIASKSKFLLDQLAETKKGLADFQSNQTRSPNKPNPARREPRMSEPVNCTPDLEYDDLSEKGPVFAKEPSLIRVPPKPDDTVSTRFVKQPRASQQPIPKSHLPKQQSPSKSPDEIQKAFMKKTNLTLTQTVSTDSNSNNAYRHLSPTHLSPPHSPPAPRLSVDRSTTSSNSPKKPSPSLSLSRSIKIEDFYLGKQLGSGKFGSVYVSKQKSTGFMCAIKVIPKEMVREENIVNQLTRELKIQSCLDHPNITKLYGFFDDDKNVYLILELGSSGQLYKVLKEKGRFSEEAASYIVKQICEAIRYLHTFKIIHRDIKPENIVIQHGIAKMCDFGWAVCRGAELRSTFCGTPLYVSPEILKGESYDQRIDLWSIGILTYELIVGDIPFEINREDELIKIIREDIVFPETIGVSDVAKDFVLKILQKNPNDRLKISQLLEHPFLNLKLSSDISSQLQLLNSH